MASDDYRWIAPWYDLVIGPFLGSLRAKGFNQFRATEGLRVLEVGCGTGAQLAHYREHDCRVTGLDRSAAMLRTARARLGARPPLCRGDAARLPFPDGAFDLVLATLVLHEMAPAARPAVLADMTRVLHPAGRIGIIDYHPAARRSIKGALARNVIRGVERAAGGDHYANYRHFLINGGLPALANRQGLRVEGRKRIAGGNIALYRLRRVT